MKPKKRNRLGVSTANKLAPSWPGLWVKLPCGAWASCHYLADRVRLETIFGPVGNNEPLLAVFMNKEQPWLDRLVANAVKLGYPVRFEECVSPREENGRRGFWQVTQ